MTASTLAVLLYGRQAGVIEQDGGWLTTRYDPVYAASPGATPLSLSMPLDALTHPRKATEAHLRGLLPDNPAVIRRWAVLAGVREGNTFGLIRSIGTDCAGGAMFVPPGQVDAALAGEGAIEPVTSAQIAQRLRELRKDDSEWKPSDEHWSLAGAQGKFTLARTAAGWGIARGMTPSTHIIKPGITRLPAQALTEHLCQDALRRAGLPAAQTIYAEFEGEPAIVIERFDRSQRADGQVMRLHQEDMCQASGVMPEHKYPADGGPGAQAIGRLLMLHAGPGEVGKFADGLIANYLLGAPDAHAKNYSVILAGHHAELAPLYDVASGLLVKTHGERLQFPKAAMSIGGENRFGAVAARHWDKLARQLGLDPGHVRERVRELGATLPDAISDAIAALPPRTAGLKVASRLPSEVASLAETTVRLLDAPAPPPSPAGSHRATMEQPREPDGRFGTKPVTEASGGMSTFT